MVKAHELRLGNLVSADSKVCTVNNISDAYVFLWFSNTLSDVMLSLSKCDPIPITEEWLLKFGFKKKKGYYLFWLNEVAFYKPNEIGTLGLYTTEDNLCDKAIRYIKYVHQLQNLYFALTGNELTISAGTATVGTAIN